MKNIFTGKPTERISFRSTATAKEEMERLAKESDMTLTDFILFLVDQEGRKREK